MTITQPVYPRKYDLRELYRKHPMKACQIALRRTRNVAPSVRLENIDCLLGGFGIESIQGEWSNGYWGNISGSYVNMGDSYAITVARLRTGPSRYDVRFKVTTLAALAGDK